MVEIIPLTRIKRLKPEGEKVRLEYQRSFFSPHSFDQSEDLDQILARIREIKQKVSNYINVRQDQKNTNPDFKILERIADGEAFFEKDLIGQTGSGKKDETVRISVDYQMLLDDLGRKMKSEEITENDLERLRILKKNRLKVGKEELDHDLIMEEIERKSSYGMTGERFLSRETKPINLSLAQAVIENLNKIIINQGLEEAKKYFEMMRQNITRELGLRMAVGKILDALNAEKVK